MRSALPTATVLVACWLALLGCGPTRVVRARTASGTIREIAVGGLALAAVQRAASEIPCPEEDLVLQELGGSGGYRVTGCATVVTYTCHFDTCVLDERREIPESGGGSGSTWSDVHARVVTARVQRALVECLGGDPPIRVTVRMSRLGRLVRSGADLLDVDRGACVDRLLGTVRIRGTVDHGRTLIVESGEATAPQEVTAEPGPYPSAGGVEAAARSAVDARAAAILACVSDDALALQVSWTRGGELDALLRGEQQGTPEEACVRAIVQGLSIEPPGDAGTIVHAVQR